MMRTPRGRMVTKRSWAYFGLKMPDDHAASPQSKLFDSESEAS